MTFTQLITARQNFPSNAIASGGFRRRRTAKAHRSPVFNKSLKFRMAVGSVNTPDDDHSTARSTVDVQRLVDFLYEDLPHAFDDQGIDRTVYDERVKFQDPITKHESLRGYLLNIACLKIFFNPKLQLHWVKQSGVYEISARWTVVMECIFLPWKPKLVLTGTSIIGINPETGKVCTYMDLWDSIRDNSYFSLEGLWDIYKQMWICWIYRAPEFGTSKYQILKRMPNYEVRNYALAEEEAHLEEYNYINNQEKSKNSRTIKGLNIAAAMKFLGEPTQDIVLKKEKILRSSLIADGLSPKAGFSLACYTDNLEKTIWNLPMSNEVLIWLEEFTMD